MHQHALRTAATLYSEGTLPLTVAAKQAGVTQTRLLRCVQRSGLPVVEPEHETDERVRLLAH
jgi:hypothetical protein